MTKKIISISNDFSLFPAGRYEKDGPYTGEGFRKNVLVPALAEYTTVTIQLDNPLGYGSSFLEEAFGGLVREEGFSEEELSGRLVFEGKKESVKLSIHSYIHKAQIEKD